MRTILRSPETDAGHRSHTWEFLKKGELCYPHHVGVSPRTFSALAVPVMSSDFCGQLLEDRWICLGVQRAEALQCSMRWQTCSPTNSLL